MENQLFISEFEGSRLSRQIEISGNHLICVSKDKKLQTFLKFLRFEHQFGYNAYTIL